MNTKIHMQSILREAVSAAIRDEKLPAAVYPEIRIEYPKEQKFGDYATPFALESAGTLRKPPLDIGAAIKPYLEKNEMIDHVDVVKPGFINIFLSGKYLFEIVMSIVRLRERYGTQTRENPKRINIEFVSANPTGPLNIVSARAAAIGDSIANLLEACGDSVEREFYVNDFGNQVNLLGVSVLARLKELNGEKADFPGEGYHGAYVKDIAAYIQAQSADCLSACKNHDELLGIISRESVSFNVAGQRKDLEDFRVRFDRWFFESTLHESGHVEKALEKIESSGGVYTENGKKIFRSTDYGDDKDRTLMREDGRPTYLLGDIAYHWDKVSRGYGFIIDIWGPDHHGYIARLRGAMAALGYDANSFRVLIAQQVNLLQEGETVRMSKRLGQFSTMRDLIDEIGIDVARYFFVMRSLESHLDFDLALAKRQSSENPVFYLQYAHARICSIFQEAAKRGVAVEYGRATGEMLANPESVSLMKLLAKYPEEVADAAETFEPHRIASYLMKLAQAFHKFYTEHRVLTDDPVMTASHCLLSDAVRIVLQNGLKLIGVSAPERM